MQPSLAWSLSISFLVGLLSTEIQTKADTASRRDQTVVAVERVMPSVVNISSKTVLRRRGFAFDWWRDNWAPFYQELPPQYSAGSGVIIDEEGYVLTNVHVVEDATEIVVTLSDDRTYPADLVIGTRRSDVALLKIRAKPGEKFTPIQFAADDDLLLGETVIALGNPFGLGGSVSKGILSSKTRRSSADQGVLEMEDWIQTDAAINPGNSGGPLVNLDAELIGLNVAIFKEGQGIGFAIPVKMIAESLAEIFTPEALKGLWLGAHFKSTKNGIEIVALEKGSPAEKSGLRQGDIVLRVNNTAPKNLFSVNREILSTADGRDITFVVRRGRESRTVRTKLVEQESYFNADLVENRLGVRVRPMAAQAAAAFGIAGGLVITEIEPNSPADHAGFQKGLVIEGVDGEAVPSVVLGAKALARKAPGETVRLTLIVPNPARRVTAEVKLR